MPACRRPPRPRKEHPPRPLPWHGHAAGLIAALLLSASASAQSVALTGSMGERALLVIDGGPPQVMAVGESRQGVTLLSTQGDTAVVEIQGQRQTLRVGESPVSVTGPTGAGGAARVVLQAGTGGHFYGTARFNGVTLPFLLDTGASDVVLDARQAESLGLNYRAGRPGVVTTANGSARAYQVQLDSVRLGAAEVFNVAATVVENGAPVILLGNSFLAHFQMKQENGQMVLEKRF